MRYEDDGGAEVMATASEQSSAPDEPPSRPVSDGGKAPSATPRGLELRKGRNSESIRMQFMYRGVVCRETLKLAHTKKNIEYAERKRGEILNAIERGTFKYQEFFPGSRFARRLGLATAPAPVVRMGELLRDQLAHAARTLSLTTADRYARVCNTHLLPKWENVPVTEVDTVNLRKWIKTFDCKLKTLRNILTPLRNALDQAVEDDLIACNPLDRLKLKRMVPRTARSTGSKPDPFSMAELLAILDACSAAERPFWQFAFGTGMRTSELIGLPPARVDLETFKVAVTQVRIEGEIVELTKTPAGLRTIDLTQGAYDALVAQRTLTGMKGEAMFVDPRYNRPWANDQALRKRWRQILKKAGVRYRKPYQTRHTFASMLLSAGVNMLYVAKMLGHADTTMVAKHYGTWIEAGADEKTRQACTAFFSKMADVKKATD